MRVSSERADPGNSTTAARFSEGTYVAASSMPSLAGKRTLSYETPTSGVRAFPPTCV
jgi:hypothetical protein